MVQKLVTVDFAGVKCQALVDSGCQVTVIKSSMLDPERKIDTEEGSRIKLKGAFGSAVDARLLNVIMTLRKGVDGETKGGSVMITCAVSDLLNSNYALLTESDYEALLSEDRVCRPTVCMISGSELRVEAEHEKNDDIELMDRLLVNKVQIEAKKQGDILLEKELNLDFEKESKENFLLLQSKDMTLSRCCKDARN